MPGEPECQYVAVLASGGLDSSVLLADLARDCLVFPLYVSMGFLWEAQEQRALQAFIAALAAPNVHPVSVLPLDIASVYAQHWSLTGRSVPDADTSDDAVYLPGRNILLISLAAVWCATHAVNTVAIGSLDGNPFPDASPEFFRDFGTILGRGLATPVEVSAPYRGLGKKHLLQRFPELPLHLTLTCLQPVDEQHCGQCNKCAERRRAYIQAGLQDDTDYVTH